MTRQELEFRMAEAFREDRERLFKVIDSMRFQPKYADKIADIEAIAEEWRGIPQEPGFPNITHPAPLPEWFPKVKFFSRWEKDVYIEKTLERRTK